MSTPAMAFQVEARRVDARGSLARCKTAEIAHERRAGVLVVTHDHRPLDVFDRILDVEDGMIHSRANHRNSGSAS
jgi:ABC-type protease/lipase transport system fused ATPase/permease subunit